MNSDSQLDVDPNQFKPDWVRVRIHLFPSSFHLQRCPWRFHCKLWNSSSSSSRLQTRPAKSYFSTYSRWLWGPADRYMSVLLRGAASEPGWSFLPGFSLTGLGFRDNQAAIYSCRWSFQSLRGAESFIKQICGLWVISIAAARTKNRMVGRVDTT